MNTADPITTAELRAAWDHDTIKLLRLRGWSFERACRSPLILWALQHVAHAARLREQSPTQTRLI